MRPNWFGLVPVCFTGRVVKKQKVHQTWGSGWHARGRSSSLLGVCSHPLPPVWMTEVPQHKDLGSVARVCYGGFYSIDVNFQVSDPLHGSSHR